MMKCLRCMMLALIVFVFLVPVAAYAQMEADFIRGADGKTSVVDAFSAEKQGEAYVYTSIGKLPAETYVSFTGNTDDTAGYVECNYYADGTLQTAWLKKEDIIPAWTLVYFVDGGYVNLPDSIAKDDQALSEYCNKYFPGREYTRDENSAMLDYDAVLSPEGTAALYKDVNRAMNVKLVKLGICTTDIITAKGDEVSVATAHLSFGDNTDKEKHIAVVNAPRTGEASLRETASSKGKLVTNAKAGRIVAVLGVQGTYTLIRYDDVQGYIRTDCLIFHTGDKAPTATGTVHIKGNVDGTDDVTIRNATSSSKAKVVSVKTGTVVNVFETSGQWYGIETDGWYGYIQSQYLNLNEE